MWTSFLKVIIECVTVLVLFYVFIFWSPGMWDLSSPTRDWTCTPCSGRLSLNHWTTREVPDSTALEYGFSNQENHLFRGEGQTGYNTDLGPTFLVSGSEVWRPDREFACPSSLVILMLLGVLEEPSLRFPLNYFSGLLLLISEPQRACQIWPQIVLLCVVLLSWWYFILVSHWYCLSLCWLMSSN